jgi:hypothetical protein
MKLVKNLLFMITLLTIGSVSAKNRSGAAVSKPATKTTTSATSPVAMPTKSFQACLQEVRSWKPSSGVINAQGVFTDKFENFVKNSGLKPVQMEALMQAGRNLHMPLSGDMLKDGKLIIDSNKNIDGLITSEKIWNEETITSQESPEYYDGWTNELKQDYLDNQITQMLQNNKEQNFPALKKDILQKMNAEWAKNQLPPSQRMDLHKLTAAQIDDTFANMQQEYSGALEKLGFKTKSKKEVPQNL